MINKTNLLNKRLAKFEDYATRSCNSVPDERGKILLWSQMKILLLSQCIPVVVHQFCSMLFFVYRLANLIYLIEV